MIGLVLTFAFLNSAVAAQTCVQDLKALLESGRLVPECREAKDPTHVGACGFAVKYVKPGTFYDLIGVKEGDLLLDVDGKQPKKPTELVDALSKYKLKKRIVVERNGDIKNIEFSCPVHSNR